jgi:hypothetical protein
MKTKQITNLMAPAIYKKLKPELAKRQISITKVMPGDDQTDATVVLGGAMDGILLQIGDGYASFNHVDKRDPDMSNWAFWFIELDQHPTLDAAIEETLKIAKENS